MVTGHEVPLYCGQWYTRTTSHSVLPRMHWIHTQSKIGKWTRSYSLVCL